MGNCFGSLLSLLLALPTGPAPAEEPAVSIQLQSRRGHTAVSRVGTTHTGGGTIDVQQPAPDTVVVTMTGVAVATDHPCRESTAALRFELEQVFEVAFADKVKAAKLTVEARAIGLLRSGPKGAASAAGGCAAVGHDGVALVSLSVPDRSVAGGEGLSLNDHAGPISVSITPGRFVLNQTWELTATHVKALLGKAASAEFAPDPALDPIWISRREPFHGAVKKDFGLQVTIRVAEDKSIRTKADQELSKSKVVSSVGAATDRNADLEPFCEVYFPQPFSNPAGSPSVDTEHVTATILDGGTVLASGVPVTIFRDTAAALDNWRCQFDRLPGITFEVGRYYRIRTDDGRSGTCSCSGFTGGGFYRSPPAVKMTGMGSLK